MKTISSMIEDCDIKMYFWIVAADDPVILEDVDKTREDCLRLADYYEGKREAYLDVKTGIVAMEES